jgi:hypothetical protein
LHIHRPCGQVIAAVPQQISPDADSIGLAGQWRSHVSQQISLPMQSPLQVPSASRTVSPRFLSRSLRGCRFHRPRGTTAESRFPADLPTDAEPIADSIGLGLAETGSVHRALDLCTDADSTGLAEQQRSHVSQQISLPMQSPLQIPSASRTDHCSGSTADLSTDVDSIDLTDECFPRSSCGSLFRPGFHRPRG